jgi:hypothetical protein
MKFITSLALSIAHSLGDLVATYTDTISAYIHVRLEIGTRSIVQGNRNSYLSSARAWIPSVHMSVWTLSVAYRTRQNPLVGR